MHITLNGKTKELLNTPTLKKAVEQLCKNRTPVITELNGKIIKNAQWEHTCLKEGDTLELLNFVGGGSFVVRT